MDGLDLLLEMFKGLVSLGAGGARLGLEVVNGVSGSIMSTGTLGPSLATELAFDAADAVIPSAADEKSAVERRKAEEKVAANIATTQAARQKLIQERADTLAKQQAESQTKHGPTRTVAPIPPASSASPKSTPLTVTEARGSVQDMQSLCKAYLEHIHSFSSEPHDLKSWETEATKTPPHLTFPDAAQAQSFFKAQSEAGKKFLAIDVGEGGEPTGFYRISNPPSKMVEHTMDAKVVKELQSVFADPLFDQKGAMAALMDKDEVALKELIQQCKKQSLPSEAATGLTSSVGVELGPLSAAAPVPTDEDSAKEKTHASKDPF